MRKAIYLIGIILVSNFSYSCKKADLDRSGKNVSSTAVHQSIEGEWFVSTIMVTKKSRGMTTVDTSNSGGTTSRQNWSFGADGHLIIHNGKSSMTIPYRLINNTKLVLSYKEQNDTLELRKSPDGITFSDNKVLPNGDISIVNIKLSKIIPR